MHMQNANGLIFVYQGPYPTREAALHLVTASHQLELFPPIPYLKGLGGLAISQLTRKSFTIRESCAHKAILGLGNQEQHTLFALYAAYLACDSIPARGGRYSRRASAPKSRESAFEPQKLGCCLIDNTSMTRDPTI